MIDYYAWGTPNGQKIAIMLEEVFLSYQLHPVNIKENQQFEPEFLKISPNNKIPAIVDSDGPGGMPISIFESGAILIYLAEKTNQLMPKDTISRMNCIQWLMFQMASVGPMFGQYSHFLVYADEKIPYGIERYGKEVRRLYRVMDLHLAKATYFAVEYSIADIAIFPWVNIHEKQQIKLEEFPHVARWHEDIAKRQAVQVAIKKLDDMMADAQK